MERAKYLTSSRTLNGIILIMRTRILACILRHAIDNKERLADMINQDV